MSVKGIAKVEILTSGKKVAESKTFETPSLNREAFSFSFAPNVSTWYNIIVTDSTGNKAISNPMWVEVVGQPEIKLEVKPDVKPTTDASYIVKKGTQFTTSLNGMERLCRL